MNIGQLSLFIFLLRPHLYSTDSWPANNVYALNGDYFEVKENALSRILIYKVVVSVVSSLMAVC
jgi:membrane-associated PAP2 superfamily phosphatase